MVLFSNESIKIFYHLNSDFVCSWMKFYYYYFFFHFWPALWGVYVLCNFLRQWLFFLLFAWLTLTMLSFLLCGEHLFYLFIPKKFEVFLGRRADCFIFWFHHSHIVWHVWNTFSAVGFQLNSTFLHLFCLTMKIKFCKINRSYCWHQLISLAFWHEYR